MKFLIFVVLFFSSLYASNLLTYNIYERSDRIDLMLSFDSPYEGKISQNQGENITTLTLGDLSYDKLIEKNINSDILQAITIEPFGESMKVILKSTSNIAIIASKTVDGFGLRVRAKPIATTLPPVDNEAQTQVIGTPITKFTKADEDLLDSRYIIVMGILFCMLIFMFWMKKKISNKSLSMQDKNSWLFNTNASKNISSSDVNVLHKKVIDEKNSVVLLEFNKVKYLVMTGSSNALLDRFASEDIKNSSDFEKAFEDNRKKLDDYLKLQQDSTFDDYKAKAEGAYTSNLGKY